MNIAGDADVEAIGEGCLEVLERVGMVFQNKEILDAIEAWGARADRATNVVTFPRKQLRAFVEGIRAEAPAPATSVSFRAAGLPGVGGSVAQFLYDDAKGEARPGRREDLVAAVKLGSALHPEAPVGHALLLSDVPPLMEPLEAALIMAEHAPSPAAPFAWDVRQIPYLEEMGHLLGLERWYSLGAVCMAHPLRFDKNVADRYVHMIRQQEQPAGLTSMPVPGVSAPITLEGFLVVTGAEYLASWVVGRALNPKVALGGSMWTGTSDMKIGHVSYSAFDAMRYSLATYSFLHRWCGVTVSVGGGEYCASRVPGYYAALEKVHKALLIAAFTGSHPCIGQGMLDNGKVLSFAQLLLERDYQVGANQPARAVQATPENMALEEIVQVGPGLAGGHLGTEHTAHHLRESLWLPAFAPRDGWTGGDDEARTLARCREKAGRLILQAAIPEGREDALAGMRTIAARAREELLDSA